MKAILEYTLPDEQAEHYCAIKGQDMLNVLFEFKAEIGSMLKYGELPDAQSNTACVSSATKHRSGTEQSRYL